MKKFTVKTPTNLKDFTDATYPQGSFAYSVLLKKGDIKVNGVKTRANVKLSTGDEVIYYTTPAQENKPSHTVIYEDENVIIADKFSGVSSEALFCELAEKGVYAPVHRLDRNTRGLIVLAKNKAAEDELLRAFKERGVEKEYACFAKDNFRQDKAVLTAYLKKDAESGTVKIFSSPSGDRVKIITEYEVVERFTDYALVKVILHTGKTHQIRAHLAYIGCPLIGDEKYGDRALNAKYSATRQILVARSVKFNLGGRLSYLNGKTFTSNFFPEMPGKRD